MIERLSLVYVPLSFGTVAALALGEPIHWAVVGGLASVVMAYLGFREFKRTVETAHEEIA